MTVSQIVDQLAAIHAESTEALRTALRLAQELLANVERYDALRDGGLRHAS